MCCVYMTQLIAALSRRHLNQDLVYVEVFEITTPLDPRSCCFYPAAADFQ